MRVDGRGAGLVAGIVGAVALVALAARGDHGDRGGSILTVSSTATSLTQTILLVVLALLILGVGLLLVLSLSVHKPELQRRGNVWARIATTIVVLLVVGIGMSRVHPQPANDAADHGGATTVVDAPRDGNGSRGDPSPAWGIGALGVAVVVLAAAGVVLAARRRQPGRVAPELPVVAPPEERDRAVARALACADPREAVLLSFAAAESVLSVDASTRRPPATSAREWSSRVDSAPLAAIVSRYEIARFSEHAVSERDRTMALDALTALQ